MPVASYLLKVVLGEFVRDAQQLPAGVCVGKGPDSQAVGGVQLSLEELAASLLNLRQLKKAGGGKQRLDVSLLYGHLETGGPVHQRPARLSELLRGTLLLLLNHHRPHDGLFSHTHLDAHVQFTAPSYRRLTEASSVQKQSWKKLAVATFQVCMAGVTKWRTDAVLSRWMKKTFQWGISVLVIAASLARST